MRLEELLFCAVFLVLPTIGMMRMVIKKLLVRQGITEAEEVKNRRDESLGAKSHKQQLAHKVFSNHKVMDYQLIESKEQVPLQFTKQKKRTHPRAGP